MSPSLDSLQTLHAENTQEPNPWSDSAPTPPLVMQPLHTPSPSALEEDVASRSGEMKSDEDRAHELDSHVPEDILDTFDPTSTSRGTECPRGLGNRRRTPATTTDTSAKAGPGRIRNVRLDIDIDISLLLLIRPFLCATLSTKHEHVPSRRDGGRGTGTGGTLSKRGHNL